MVVLQMEETMTEQPEPTGPAMRIAAATLTGRPGMDPNNPWHVLRVEFGPVATEITIPESNVDKFLEVVAQTLRRQVAAARSERLGAPQGLLVPGLGDNLPEGVRDMVQGLIGR